MTETQILRPAATDDRELQSKVISFLRFPLIVGVVMIHSLPQGVPVGELMTEVGGDTAYDIVHFVISDILARIAVPLFYFISGFLFFKGPFTADTYAHKLRRRAKTILLPYVLWNLFVTLQLYTIQTLYPQITAGAGKLVATYTAADWLSVFWTITDGTAPACFQLWFLRDLMVVMVLSPLIYLGISYLRQWFVIALGVLWLCGIEIHIPGLSICSFCFFSWGALFGIGKRNFVSDMRPLLVPAAVGYTILSIVLTVLRNEPYAEYILNCGIIAGLVLAVTLSACLISRGKWHVNEFLSESSFFIYAYHATMLALLTKISAKVVILPANELEMFTIYLLTPTITILIGLGVYYLLKKYLPGFTGIITGGR